MALPDVVLEDARWLCCDIQSICTRAMAATLAHLGIDAQMAEITILACDDTRIAALNADFRGKLTPTNVLSWPSDERAASNPGDAPAPPEPDPDGAIPLGDIAISIDTCTAEAHAAGKTLTDHALHLIVHGILHLLGYDHSDDPDAALMEGLETAILCKMGIDDPY